MGSGSERKKVAIFDPRERSRKRISELLVGMGYKVHMHQSPQKLVERIRGEKPVDLCIVNLAILGQTYQEAVTGLQDLGLAPGTPPVIALTDLHLSGEARRRLDELGVAIALGRQAPVLELLFAVNRLLFPKIRELRRYARVFGGFPVQYLHEGQWRQAQVYNISQEGAFIQCDQPPAEDTRMQVRFVLPESDVPIECNVCVNWVNDPDNTQDHLSPRGMGVHFLAMDQAESTSLERFIAERVNGNGLSS